MGDTDILLMSKIKHRIFLVPTRMEIIILRNNFGILSRNYEVDYILFFYEIYIPTQEILQMLLMYEAVFQCNKSSTS